MMRKVLVITLVFCLVSCLISFAYGFDEEACYVTEHGILRVSNTDDTCIQFGFAGKEYLFDIEEGKFKDHKLEDDDLDGDDLKFWLRGCRMSTRISFILYLSVDGQNFTQIYEGNETDPGGIHELDFAEEHLKVLDICHEKHKPEPGIEESFLQLDDILPVGWCVKKLLGWGYKEAASEAIEKAVRTKADDFLKGVLEEAAEKGLTKQAITKQTLEHVENNLNLLLITDLDKALIELVKEVRGSSLAREILDYSDDDITELLLMEQWQAAVKKIRNIVRDHAGPEKDFFGVIKERKGFKILKGEGEYWKHVQEMTEASEGLTNQMAVIEKALEKKNMLSDDAIEMLENSKQLGDEVLTLMLEALNAEY